MKNLLRLLCALMLLAACSGNGEKMKISAKYDNLREADLLLFCENGTFRGVDTLKLQKGKFSFSVPIAETQIYTIIYPNQFRTSFVAEPGSSLKIRGNANRLEEVDVSGTKMNERLSEFRHTLVGRPDADRLLAAEQYIRDHAKTPDAMVVFTDFFVYNSKADAHTARSLLDAMRRAGQPSHLLLHAERALLPGINLSVGDTIPAFTTTDIDGKNLSWADYKGHPTVVAVWANWEKQSRDVLRVIRSNPAVRNQKVKVLNISLDPSEQSCRNSIRQDSVRGRVVREPDVFDSPMARTLGLRYVPSVLLVDANGKLVARDVLQKEINDKINALVH